MKDNIGNMCSEVRKETHLEIRLGSLKESNSRLERVQNLEVRISGDRITDLKDEPKTCIDEPKPSRSALITDLQDLNHRTNYLLTDIEEGVSHLEDFI